MFLIRGIRKKKRKKGKKMPDILIVNKEGMEWRRVIICRKCSNDGEEIKEWSESNSRFI